MAKVSSMQCLSCTKETFIASSCNLKPETSYGAVVNFQNVLDDSVVPALFLARTCQ